VRELLRGTISPGRKSKNLPISLLVGASGREPDRRAEEAERAQVYTGDEVEICKCMMNSAARNPCMFDVQQALLLPLLR